MAVGTSPSLSDSSLLLLLLSSSSCFLGWAWVAAGPALPGGVGRDPFLGKNTWMYGVEAALTWGIFPEGFAWRERNRIRGESTDGGLEETGEQMGSKTPQTPCGPVCGWGTWSGRISPQKTSWGGCQLRGPLSRSHLHWGLDSLCLLLAV